MAALFGEIDMRVGKFVFAAGLVALPLIMPPVAQAQDVRSLAEEYVAMPQVQQMMDELFAPQAMTAQFLSGLPAGVEVPADKAARIGQVLSDQLNNLRPDLERIMVEGSVRVFTAPELLALIEFYRSEHGASVMGKMQPFMQNVMGELAPRIQQTQQAILPEIIAIIEE
jgi:hypothetical protein